MSRTQVGKPRLTPELAEEINQKVGRYLGDEVKVEDLVIPSESAGEYRKSIQAHGFEGYHQVNKRVRAIYNTCLISSVRRRYSTLGDIRDTEVKIAPKDRHNRHIGKARSAFVKSAFARPQADKQ